MLRSQAGCRGTRSGEVTLLSLVDGQPKSIATHSEPGAVHRSVAISPKGDEVVYSFQARQEAWFSRDADQRQCLGQPVSGSVESQLLVARFCL